MNFKIEAPIIDNGKFLNDLPTTQEAGCPEIAYYSKLIMLPYGHKVDSIEIYKQEERVMDFVLLLPAQEDTPISEQDIRKYKRNDDLYASDKLYPVNDYDYTVSYKNGRAILAFHLYPYRYNPSTNTLYYHKSIQVEINTIFDESIKEKENRQLVCDLQTYRQAAKMVVNPEQYFSYVKEPVIKTRNVNSIVSDNDPYDMIILTTNAYKNNVDMGIQDYADWKTSQGIKTKVFTVEEIYPNYSYLEQQFLFYNYPPSLDNQMRIRNFIKDAYETYSNITHPLKYLLILGDRNAIPSRNFPMIYDGNYRTLWGDIYYSNLGGNGFFNDDQNLYNNGRKDYGWSRYYSSHSHGFDLYADIEVGRFCGATAEQFSNFFDKCRKYETAKPQDSDIGLHVAQHNSVCMCSRLVGAGKFDSFVTDEYNYEQRCYCTTGYRERNIMPEYQKGCNLIANKSHAISWNSVTVNWEDILYNDYAGILYNEACSLVPLTSGIRTSLMVSSPYAFTHIIGNSNYGWVTTSTYFTNRLSEVFFNDNPVTVGELHHQHKDLEIARRTIGSTYSRWVYWNINLMGDPSLKIKTNYTGESMTLIGFNVYRDGVKINAEPLASVDRAFLDMDLIAGTTYTYYVTAVYTDGESAASNTASAEPYELRIPYNLVATARHNSIELSWELDEG